MNVARILLVFLALIGFQVSNGQLITKKEAAGIDKILEESADKYKPKTYVFNNVSLLTMTDSVLLENQNVLVEGGRIKKIGKDVQQPDAIQIDGTGKFLMPGLTDMHVHLLNHHPLKNTWMLLLLLNGVTNVRDMLGESDKIALRNKINNNDVLAPNLYQAGPIINSAKDPYGLFVGASTPEEGRKIVIQHKQAGYDFIKVYDGLKKDVFEAIADEARKQSILVVGHIPAEVNVTDAIQAGQNSAEHLNGYKLWKDGKILLKEETYAGVTANSEMWNCPTLYNFSVEWSIENGQSILNDSELSGLLPHGTLDIWQKRLKDIPKEARESIARNGVNNTTLMKEIVFNLYKSNAKLITGTDAGSIPFLVPGYSLHEELRMMNEIGIPNYDVLKMTTSNAALSMQKDSDFGTVEEGKRADLLLLNSNPLTDIQNLKDKNGIMIRGIWLSREDIDQISNKIKSTFSN
jgi:imidazolonepropionase-like amidohydrolase